MSITLLIPLPVAVLFVSWLAASVIYVAHMAVRFGQRDAKRQVACRAWANRKKAQADAIYATRIAAIRQSQYRERRSLYNVISLQVRQFASVIREYDREKVPPT